MDVHQLTIAIVFAILASYVINAACNSFDDASEYLGRNLPDGIKGATINAIGSSLPELLTTFFLLFVYHDRDGFSAGVATCAGSAVFNLAVIPAICILAVVGLRRRAHDDRVQAIMIRRRTIVRDGAFFLMSEFVLIGFLGNDSLKWWMGGLLFAIYILYMGNIIAEIMTMKRRGEATRDIEYTPPQVSNVGVKGVRSLLVAITRFDFNVLVFRGKALNTKRAWIILGLATGVIAAACHILATAVMDSAEAMRIAPYFTAVILGAAATSVPDLVLSLKDAKRGKYDDAISNAVGSNIFDITVALGLPLMIYAALYGDVSLHVEGSGQAQVQDLRITLVAITLMVLTIFLWGRALDRRKAVLLLATYALWIAYIVASALEWSVLERLFS